MIAKVKILKRDICCTECGRATTRPVAEEHEWIELILCDAAGMPIESGGFICDRCQKRDDIANRLRTYAV